MARRGHARQRQPLQRVFIVLCRGAAQRESRKRLTRLRSTVHADKLRVPACLHRGSRRRRRRHGAAADVTRGGGSVGKPQVQQRFGALLHKRLSRRQLRRDVLPQRAAGQRWQPLRAHTL